MAERKIREIKEASKGIRLLKASEIECRVSSVSEKGVVLLLYKDARVDQRILDETFGPFGWKRSHQSIEGNLYCTVEIYDNAKKEWVAKQDVGTFGYAEKEKSQASDSFKRACFNWGIGRELYSAPFIWVSASKIDIRKKGDGFICLSRFRVVGISYSDEREINGLRIINEKGNVVYEIGLKEKPVEKKEEQEKPQESEKKQAEEEDTHGPTVEQLEELDKEMIRTGVNFEAVQERYKIEDISDLTPELYNRVMRALKKTKDAA